MTYPVRTLVVEDHPHMRSILRPVVRSMLGGTIDDAKDAVEALKKLKEHHFDLMLVDLQLPTMSGLELIQLIRREDDSPAPTIPIIVVSAHATELAARQARDAGANAFVAKPITPLRLARHMEAVIQDKRPFVRTRAFFGPDRRRPGPVKRAHKGPWRRSIDHEID